MNPATSLHRSTRYCLFITAAAIGVALLGPPKLVRAETASVPLWKKTPEKCPTDSLLKQAKQCVAVKVDSKVLELRGVDVLLPLPDGPSIRASRVEGPTSEQAFIWHGTVKGETFSSITFAVVKDAVVGVLVLDGKMYRLRSPAKGVRIVELLDPRQIPHDLEPRKVQSRNLMSSPLMLTERPNCYYGNPFGCVSTPDACWTDSPNRVDVMVLYTNAAFATAGAQGPEMTAWISLQEARTNLSYAQSNAALQIRVVHDEEVSYTEVSTEADRTTLTLQCDGTGEPLNRAHILRDTFNADVVILITNLPGILNSGASHQLKEYDVGTKLFEPCAFGVVQVASFVSPVLTFAHELGHLMGAQHSRPAEPGAIPGSSYAHIDKTPAACTAPWMTIMGNECEVCSTSDPEDCTVCTQAPYWSNPDSDVSFCGEVVGSDDDNNRDTLNLTALTVANFRCGAPTADDVWMKDAWEDTGSEPDSNLATEPVWKSPYVWVRNAPDTSVNFEKQHQHQNPITGQTNYIYIKVHNGGVATSGTLQVLAADAATGLSWPTSFTQVGSADIVFLPKSTRIVELPWAPTESGHFSLIARWSSVSDAIAVPEGPSIDTNVRSNNNIVWRNVNIVDLGPATDSSSATFIVRNLVDTQARMSLKLKPSDRYPGHSFFSAGSVSVHLSDQVFAAWRKGAFDGNGFTRDGQDLQIVDANGATLEGLVFEAGSEGEIVITFSRQNDSDVVPRGMFLIDVIQSTLKQTEVAVDGGITYEIHSQ